MHAHTLSVTLLTVGLKTGLRGKGSETDRQTCMVSLSHTHFFFQLFYEQKSYDSVDSRTEYMFGTVPSGAVLYCSCTCVRV